MSIGETLQFFGCSPRIQQPAAANLYSKRYTLLLNAAVLCVCGVCVCLCVLCIYVCVCCVCVCVFHQTLMLIKPPGAAQQSSTKLKGLKS